MMYRILSVSNFDLEIQRIAKVGDCTGEVCVALEVVRRTVEQRTNRTLNALSSKRDFHERYLIYDILISQ